MLYSKQGNIILMYRGFSVSLHPKLTILALLLFLALPHVSALPEYSQRTNQSCNTCHVDLEEGTLTGPGLEYAASGYSWPPTSGYRVLGPFKKSVRLMIGYIHILASFLWFGTILYVHIVLRPGYASKGLPKGEVALGLVSMVLVGITGALLTISRIKSIDVLYKSPWGTVLSTKIFLYLVMVSSAIFVVTFIGPRIKKQEKRATVPDTGGFDAETLDAFDGSRENPAYFAFDGNVYDATELEHWKDGTHMKHHAGMDLTGALERAPHGPEKLESLEIVGSFDADFTPPKPKIQKVFYFVAYLNLVLVFFVLFTIAYWRWGL
jgi:predicted heme/steroid binding protein